MFGSSIPSIPLTAPIGNMMGGFNGGYGCGNDNSWWAWIILFALFGGWGNRNGNNNNGMPSVVYMDRGVGSGISGEVQRGFDTSTVISKLDGINNGICSLGYDQLAQMNGVNTSIMQTGYNIQNGITQMGIAQMQDTNALSRQLGDCCCENRQGQAYNEYQSAKRHYTMTNSQTDKDEMTRHANEHVADTMETVREIYKSADPDLKKRIKTDLTKLISEMPG